MEKCPVCGKKLRLTPLVRIKYYKARPCPHCGALIRRLRWPMAPFFAGFMMCLGTGDMFNVEKQDWVRQLALEGRIHVIWGLMAAWGIIALPALAVGLFFLNRYTIAKEQ